LKRKFALLTALATVGSLAVVALPAHAGAPPVNGTGGTGDCANTGQISIKPGLVNGGTSPTVIKVKTKPPKGATAPCPGASGDGNDVVSGSSSGSGTGTTNDCGGLAGTATSNLVLTVKWKMSKTATNKKIAPSTIGLTSQTGGLSGDLHGTFDVTGTVTAGSFVGDVVTSHVKTDQSAATIGAACGGKGLKKITFGVKADKGDSILGGGDTNIHP